MRTLTFEDLKIMEIPAGEPKTQSQLRKTSTPPSDTEHNFPSLFSFCTGKSPAQSLNIGDLRFYRDCASGDT
jgi:hypothetical protein